MELINLKRIKSLLVTPTILLTISQFISLGFSFITSIIIANSLGLEKFGVYAFYFSITSIFLLFFRFGYFSSIGVLLVKNHNRTREKELLGAGLVLNIVIGIFYGLFLYIISDVVTNIFDTDISKYILFTLPFLILLPITMYITQVAQSLHNFKPLIFFNISSAIISFTAILYLYFSQSILVEYFIYAKIIPITILAFIAILYYGFNFNNIFKNLILINLKNKKHGFHLYLGQISDQFVYKSDELMISYFIGNSELGLYKIAQSLTSPFSILPKNYAISKYRILSNTSYIDSIYQNRLIQLSISMMILGAIFSIFIINYFYTQEYFSAVYIALILSLIIFFNSIFQLYNNFLNGHSLGKDTRNNSLKMGIINLIGNIVLIPLFGAIGASIASALAMFSYYIFSKITYKNYLNRNENVTN